MQPITVVDPRVTARSRITVRPEELRVTWVFDGGFGVWHVGPSLSAPLEGEYEVG